MNPIVAFLGLALVMGVSSAQSWADTMPRPLSVLVEQPSVIAPGIDHSAVFKLPLGKSRPLALPVAVRDIIIGNPAIADVVVRSPREIYLMGKAAGDTNVFLLDRDGRTIGKVEVNVHLDIDSLNATLRHLLPDERVAVDAVGDSLFLSGKISSDGAAANAQSIARRFVAGDDKVVSMMQVIGDQQVLLQVRVAEMQKSVLKELGVSYGTGSLSAGDGTLALATTGAGATATAFGTLAGANLFTGLTAFTLSALERQGLVKTLAEPNLTAVSGEEAKLLAGGEYPIPVEDSDGQITFEFKPFGVSLAFVPVVLDGGRISLKMATEVSALSSTITVTTANTVIPAITVRRANTTVELPSGGSLMIAGLLKNDLSNTFNGLPGLQDLPILGALFRSSSWQREETELVINVAAYVVKPVDAKLLALPTDGFVPASDLDRYLLGRIQTVYNRRAEAELQGPFGYIVE